jgi:DNA-binding NarL/FixJ family response regulator
MSVEPTPGAGMTRDLNTKIRVVLVDDHRLFREGVSGILSKEDDFEVVVEGMSQSEVVGLVHQYRPDVLLIGLRMPGMSPVLTIRQVVKASPSTRIVILSTHSDNDVILRLITAGAAACLSNDIGGQELVSELRTVAANNRMFTIRGPRYLPSEDESAKALTDRELEILGLVSTAMSNSQIAMELYLSEATVKRHLTNIFGKLKARSRLDAVNRAISLGMVMGPDSWPF